MGGKNKNKAKKQQASEPPVKKAQPRLSMDDLEAMSDDSDDQGSLPPQDEWNAEAKQLRDAIMSGKFDELLELEDGDASSVEDVELGDDDDDASDDEQVTKKPSKKGKQEQSHSSSEDEESEEESEEEEDEAPAKRKGKHAAEEASSEDEEEASEEEQDDDDASAHGNDVEAISSKNAAEASDDEEESESESVDAKQAASDDDEDEDEVQEKTMDQKNQISSKALHVVTDELALQKKGWSWAETFDIVPATPLPFDKKADPEGFVDIHDDLKREVTFYDIALEAVNEARLRCKAHDIPFTRPDDFFAEMVKTDGTCGSFQYCSSTWSLAHKILFPHIRPHGQNQGQAYL